MTQPRFIEIGKTHGRMTVTEVLGTKHKRRMVRATCACGQERIVSIHCLYSGRTKSCGCLQRELCGARAATHRMMYTPAWSSWQSMKKRCLNPKEPSFSDYGGRGITVCERWLKFENFFADMGERTAGMTLDRIDVNGNYEPGNCRWATWHQQAQNKTGNSMNALSVVLIRHMYRRGSYQKDIAHAFGIRQSHVSKIVRYETWPTVDFSPGQPEVLSRVGQLMVDAANASRMEKL